MGFLKCLILKVQSMIEPKNHRWSLNVSIMALYGAYFINADSFTDIDHARIQVRSATLSNLSG